MLGQSDRLGRLVESLLDFGRMQAREYNFRSDRLEAADITRSVSEEFQQTVSQQRVTRSSSRLRLLRPGFAGIARR